MANKVYLPKFYGSPQVIHAELTISGGHLGFVPEGVERQHPSSNESIDMILCKHGANGAKDGAWCHDLEMDSGVDKQNFGCKNLMQYIWVNLGRASP